MEELETVKADRVTGNVKFLPYTDV